MDEEFLGNLNYLLFNQMHFTVLSHQMWVVLLRYILNFQSFCFAKKNTLLCKIFDFIDTDDRFDMDYYILLCRPEKKTAVYLSCVQLPSLCFVLLSRYNPSYSCKEQQRNYRPTVPDCYIQNWTQFMRQKVVKLSHSVELSWKCRTKKILDNYQLKSLYYCERQLVSYHIKTTAQTTIHL